MDKLKVMLVDDETQAIEYLRELIDWKAYGFEIAAEAFNGKMALEYFDIFKPSLIIADISMPGMDGLELCEEISKKTSNCKVILLTAYSEFEYAKKAIQLGVSNYLLKHMIDENTLTSELIKVKEEIAHQINVKEIVTKHTMRHYIEGDEESALKIKEEWYFREDNRDTLVMLVLKPDMPYKLLTDHNASELPILNVEQQIKEFAETFDERYEFIDVIKYKENQHILFFRVKEICSSRIIFLRFHDFAESMNEMLAADTGLTFSAAITSASAGSKISDLYRRCEKALEFLPAKGRAQVLNADEYSSLTGHTGKEQKVNQYIYPIIQALDNAKENEMDKSIENVFDFILYPSFNPHILRICCRGIERELVWWRNERDLPAVEKSSSLIYQKLFNCYTLEEMKTALREVCRLCLQQMMDKNIHSYSKKVQKAINYLNEHYASDLVVLDVADALEISESSLSKSFKQETGYSVLEYLKMIRMHQAKQLLKTTNLKIYEVSELVGYKTSQYFSQVFIKSVGMNPLEFREGKNAPL